MVNTKKLKDYSVATFAMPHDLAKRIKQMASARGKRGVSMSAYIRMAVEVYLVLDEVGKIEHQDEVDAKGD